MARQETKYIVIHCSQTRPSQKWGAKEIDRVHREFGWTKIGYGKVIKRDGTVEQGREDDAVQADAQIVGHYMLDEAKTCPNFNVREYLLNEDIKNYKFQDGLTDDADLAELEDEPTE